ncbi:ferritin-like domain-containing protein [Pyruvatibacter mobilis]|uniref:ferritin-like domain-containing protein n=1 Tax=Pyruvatibacter mobilis TaxID=1712261 RepID=UPI003BAA1D6E
MAETQKDQITKDNIYNTVEPDDFAAMIECDRYLERASAFDKIISATHDHFWDPMDKRYIDFSTPFDIENEYMVEPEMTVGFGTAVWDKLDEKNRIKLTNLDTHWSLSNILHGEQGAMALSASLCHILRDPGAQEYAANQAREEARHVTAFIEIVRARFGKPMACGPVLRDTLTELVNSKLAWKKIVGMQLLIEGLAMGAFATFYNKGRDPLIIRLAQLAMTDEAFHHKFGKIWADRTIPHLNEDEHNKIEDWAWQVFSNLLYNLASPDQKKHIYEQVGLDWEWVQGAFMEGMTDEKVRENMQQSSNIFRVLVKTLLMCGIITKRTAGNYAAYIDMQQLHMESDEMVGDSIAAAGIEQLRKINSRNEALRSLSGQAAD